MLFWRRPHPIRDEDLSAYVDGELGPEARARLEAHLAACSSCRETLAELRALRSALSALPLASAPRSFALGEEDVRPAPRPTGGFARAPLALAGMATFAFLAFWTLVSVDLLSQPADVANEAGFEAAAPDGAEQAAPASEPPVQRGDADATGAEEATQGGLSESSEAPLPPPTCSPNAFCAPNEEAARVPSPVPLPSTGSEGEEIEEEADDGGRGALRAAEVVLAALTLGAAGSFAFVWWRRRAAERSLS